MEAAGDLSLARLPAGHQAASGDFNSMGGNVDLSSLAPMNTVDHWWATSQSTSRDVDQAEQYPDTNDRYQPAYAQQASMPSHSRQIIPFGEQQQAAAPEVKLTAAQQLAQQMVAILAGKSTDSSNTPLGKPGARSTSNAALFAYASDSSSDAEDE